MKITGISGDLLVTMVLAAAGIYAGYSLLQSAKSGLNSGIDTVSSALEWAAGVPSHAYDYATEKLAPITEIYEAAPYQSPALKTVDTANEMLAQSPLNPVNWPGYWMAGYDYLTK